MDEGAPHHDPRGALAEGQESPYAEWLANWQPRSAAGSRRGPGGDFFETRDRALLAHATQVDPDGYWFQVPRELQQRVWPVEEFELAMSYVPVDCLRRSSSTGSARLAEADALAKRAAVDSSTTGSPRTTRDDPAERVEHPNEPAEGGERGKRQPAIGPGVWGFVAFFVLAIALPGSSCAT